VPWLTVINLIYEDDGDNTETDDLMSLIQTIQIISCIIQKLKDSSISSFPFLFFIHVITFPSNSVEIRMH